MAEARAMQPFGTTSTCQNTSFLVPTLRVTVFSSVDDAEHGNEEFAIFFQAKSLTWVLSLAMISDSRLI